MIAPASIEQQGIAASQGRPLALISTIEPIDGGVPAMTRCLTGLLEELGIEPVFAWYEPWSRRPDLSVPLPSMVLGRRPGSTLQKAYGDHEGHSIGAWLPELEFTHYLPRRHWRDLISACRFHLSVTGNPLCAAPYARLGIPFLAWVATPWQADRTERVQTFSPSRRLLDRYINSPILRGLERQILRAPKGRILALSQYTARELQRIAQRPMDGVLLMPVDRTRFHPDPQRVIPWRIGFTGRYGDPRKNIDLLLVSVAKLAAAGHPVQLELAGEMDTQLLKGRISDLGIGNRVHCRAHLASGPLAELLQSLDVFVIPSHQEGLCIAALEAMSCGVPVVSTRCGGPEEYVSDRTGKLVESNPEAMADAIRSICADRNHRLGLGADAATWVSNHASITTARRTLRHQLGTLYPDFDRQEVA